jgi:Mrp family chromosome partitioning ATPase
MPSTERAIRRRPFRRPRTGRPAPSNLRWLGHRIPLRWDLRSSCNGLRLFLRSSESGANGLKSTLVVDADLTGPMVARLLGLRPQVGLDDVVENGQALSDALIDAHDDHLGILPMRSAVSRPRDFLATPAWTCTLARLRREYDLILVDGGPLFSGLSAAILHRSVDAAILVTHRGMTGERAVVRAREVLEAGGVPLLGLAETFV